MDYINWLELNMEMDRVCGDDCKDVFHKVVKALLKAEMDRSLSGSSEDE